MPISRHAVYDEAPLRPDALDPVIAFSAKHGLIQNVLSAATLAPAIPG